MIQWPPCPPPPGVERRLTVTSLLLLLLFVSLKRPLHYWITSFVIHWTLTLFWLAESVQWIFEISARDVISADYTIIMSRTLKVTGNHGKFALCVASRQWRSKNRTSTFFFVQCIIKQSLDSGFVISRIIKVSVRIISLSLGLWLITLTSILIILDILKASSYNCVLYGHSNQLSSSFHC